MMTDENKKISRLIYGLADSPTALICNAYDFLGMHAPCTDWNIRCATPYLTPMVGMAITIKLWCGIPDETYRPEPSHRDSSLYYEMIERAEKTGVPNVAVIQSMGEKQCGAVLGDGMAKSMVATGIVGCVTDGAARDLDGIEKAGLALFCGGMVQNHYALHWAELGAPVVIGGVTIKTGDIIHGDRDGIITLPEAGWGRVIEACRLTQDFEKAAHVVFRRRDMTQSEIQSEVDKLAERYGGYITALKDEF